MEETGRKWGLHFPSLSMWKLYALSLIWEPWRGHSVRISDGRTSALYGALPFGTTRLSPSWANQGRAPKGRHNSTNEITSKPDFNILMWVTHLCYFRKGLSSLRSTLWTFVLRFRAVLPYKRGQYTTSLKNLTIFRRTFRTGGVEAGFPSSDSSSESAFFLRDFWGFLLTGVFGGEAASFFVPCAVDVGFDSLVAAFFRGRSAPSPSAIDASSSPAFPFFFFDSGGRVFFVGRASCISSSESSGCDLRFLALLFCTISGSASSSCWSN